MKNTIIEAISDVKVRVRTPNGGYRDFDLHDLFSVDDTDIIKEYTQQAALYGYFAAAEALAEEQVANATRVTEVDYAVADSDYRGEAEKNGRKITETQIRSMILSDADYDKTLNLELKAKAEVKMLKAIVAALDMRANMLVSLGAHMRSELDQTGMNVKENQFNKSVNEAKSNLAERHQARE